MGVNMSVIKDQNSFAWRLAKRGLTAKIIDTK